MQLLLSRSLTLASSKLNNFRVSGEFSFCWMIRFWNRISGLLDWSLSKLSRPRVSFESQQNFFKKLITFFQTVSELRSSFCRYKIESVTFWFGVFVLLILRTSKGLFFFLLTRQFFPSKTLRDLLTSLLDFLSKNSSSHMNLRCVVLVWCVEESIWKQNLQFRVENKNWNFVSLFLGSAL